jgi:ribokinase
VLGSINMDLVVRAPRLPDRGETLLGGPFARHPGGKGANQAVAAARLGARVAMVGRVGADEHGRALVAGLAAEGIDVAGVAADPDAPTGVALITVDERGENTIVVSPGANAALGAAELEAALDLAASCDVVLAQLEVPLESVARAARVARAAGTLVVLNAAPAAPLPAPLLRDVDVLVVNEPEARAIAGGPVESRADAEDLAAGLAAAGPGIVVVTLGARGCVARHRGATVRHPAFAVQAVDATAAGDAFVGALAAALAAEGPAALPAALRLASAAGALAASGHGAQPSLPGRSAVETLLGGA